MAQRPSDDGEPRPWISGAPTAAPCAQCCRSANIVYDKFHLWAYLNKAVDALRKAEYRQLAFSGQQTLKGSEYPWLRSFPAVAALFRHLYRLNRRTSRAWRLKETIEGFWQYCYEGSARRFFADWLAQVTRSGLTLMKKVAEILARHLPSLLNYLKYRITNAASEASTHKWRASSPSPPRPRLL